MLDAEETRARLRSAADDHWRSAAEKRIRRLRRRLRPLAVPFLAPVGFVGGYADRLKEKQQRLDAAATLDDLPPDRLEAVLAALHPKLGSSLAAWWVAAQSEPYPTGWARRAFRAPHHPAATRGVRAERLHQLLAALGPYDQDAPWVAAWGHGLGTDVPQSGFSSLLLGPLLGAVIDRGGAEGDAVFQTLVQISNGEHPIGVMDRHVITGLLRSHRPDGWDVVERLLLAAQRQEGLRQSILEAVDEAAPAAFDRLLDVILEHDLLRFAATVRAATVWLGFSADVEQIPAIRERLTRLVELRRDRVAAEAAIRSDDRWDAYLGLCVVAMDDVFVAIDRAAAPYGHVDPNLRAVAIRFLEMTSIVGARPPRFDRLDDPDLGVAALAFSTISSLGANGWNKASADPGVPTDAFDRFERLARRLPEKKRSIADLGVEVVPVVLDREAVVSQLLWFRGARPLEALAPWVTAMGAAAREQFAFQAGKQGHLTSEMRSLLLSMVGDRSSRVREQVVDALGKATLAPAEAPELEALLTRKAGDLRRGVIGLLLRQPLGGALASAERLWATGNGPQRDAACEVLAQLARSHPREVVPVAMRLASDGPSAFQLEQLVTIPGVDAAPPAAPLPPPPVPSGDGSTAAPAPAPAPDPPAAPDPPIVPAGATGAGEIGAGLGLYDPARRTAVRRPRPVDHRPSPVAGAIVSELDDLVADHRDTAFVLTTWQGATDVLLGDADHWLPHPFHSRPDDGGGGMVLADVFRPWWEQRAPGLRTATGCDAVDALALLEASAQGRSTWVDRGAGAWWLPMLRSVVGGEPGELRHRQVVEHVLLWLAVDEAASAPEAVAARALDGIEAVLGSLPAPRLAELVGDGGPRDWRSRQADWRPLVGSMAWTGLLGWQLASTPSSLPPAALLRWFGLLQWLDRPRAGVPRHHAPAGLVLRAFEEGGANEDDLLDVVMAERHRTFAEWTRRRRGAFAAAHPGGVEVVDRLRARVIEIERVRGELPTPASALATRVGSIEGADLALDLLARLGRATLVRGYLGSNEGREAVFSHLLQVSYPADGDDAASVRALAAVRKLKDARLVDLAVFAPQWSALIEDALDWPGLAEGVWWYHAHTKDDRWSVDHDVRETWAALSAERTPLAAEDLVAGAVDVDWYRRARADLGDDRWKVLHKAAKLASGGSGHRRAQLFAEAMDGSVSEAALRDRIGSKRHQDSVRALGLVPLPSDPAERDAAALERYGVLREFERGSKAFGSQRQASEATAVRIGVENLARTSGYPDPQRFIWAMEAAEAGDLADGPVVVSDDDLTVTLSVDGEGTPTIGVARGDKKLASVPAKHRKAPAIVELRARKTALTRQATRVRSSLEAAMVRGDAFHPGDFDALRRHPVVAPMLDLLVFVDEQGRTARRHEGRLLDASGAEVSPQGALRIAHPVDLAGGAWTAWQEQVYGAGQKQPFRQVFRELYALTEAERATGPRSLRWSGHQVQPRQSAALFGRRGWLVDREAGDVSRVFHAHDTVARVAFADGFGTPAEVELPTIEAVYFTRRGEYLAQPIDQVPPVVFSEAMRDLDLVVSVAHAGGVDPEATASTVEMRAALVRETTRMMRLDNVREVGSHVVIEGRLGEYSVHLGSGSVHRRPGGAICIIPVDAQRRGRIFLPFADDDPKTAEVLAKVLLLARDHTIKDPSILEQLRS